MGRRHSIEIPGLPHKNPIPMASRIGPFLVSSVITGKDPRTNQAPPELELQCSLMFENVRRVMEVAGASTEDIINFDIWLKDASDKSPINKQWLAMFPDPESRPARHVFQDAHFQPECLVQCQIMAVIDTP